jgi:hypothetical protein
MAPKGIVEVKLEIFNYGFIEKINLQKIGNFRNFFAFFLKNIFIKNKYED